MNAWRAIRFVLMCSAAFVLFAMPCVGQSVSVAVTSPLPVLTVSGSTTDTKSMTVTTSWSGWLGFIYFTGQTCVYMTGPLVGTGGNPDTIPVSNVQVTTTDGTRAINSSTDCGVTGATQINSFAGWSWSSGNKTTQVQVQVTNTSNLAADQYNGTIYLIAQVN